MLRLCIAVFCLILSVHTQNYPTQNPYFFNDQIYFADTIQEMLQRPFQSSNSDSRGLQQFALPVLPLTKNDPAYEIEKSNELSATTTYGVEQQKPVVPKDSQAANSQMAQAIHGQIAQAPSVTPQATSDQALRAQIAKALSAQSEQAPHQVGYNKILYSVCNFGLNLLKNINQQGNVVVSPYSITTLLALLQQGAQGQTQKQITEALQVTPSDAVTSFTEITDDVKQRNSHNILKTANNVFVANGFTLNPGFKKLAQGNFDSDVTSISFSRPEPAARQINNWVALHTNNKIEKLVAPESLDETTQVVLVNTVYFKGLWEIPFRVQTTKPREFQLSNGAKKIVPFMSTRRLVKTGFDSTTNALIAILPFERAQYSMMFILPSPLLGISGTLEQMTDARLLSYHSFKAMEAALHIPKFTVRADTDLVQVLRKMGITNIFGPSSELTGLGAYRTFSPQISSAVHSAVLSIDEEGGSAAAATSFAAVALSNDDPSVVFRADRPFIAILWDEKTSLPLFMAKIEDPTGQ